MKPASLNLSTPAPPALSKTKPFFFSLSERQVITTDPTNILIRSLLMKKERDARDRKAKEKAKAVAAAAAAKAAAEQQQQQQDQQRQQQPAASGAKRGGSEPPAGEPAAKREAVDSGAANATILA